MKERGNSLLKFCDKYIGIPLIIFLGMIHQKRSLKSPIFEKSDPKIILLKTAGIGDTILLSAIIKEIKYGFPKSAITLVCTKSNYQGAKCISDLTNIHVFDISKPIVSLKAITKLGKFDLLLDFAPWARINSIISYFTRADFKVGFKRKGMYRHYIYDLAVEHKDNIHEIENYRNIMYNLNLELQGFVPIVSINQDSRPNARSLVKDNECNIIVHPFPGGTKKDLKEWPSGNWVQLIETLCNKGSNIFITGGKEDYEAALEIRASIIPTFKDKCQVIAGSLSLLETAAVIKNADLLITVNTGIMHLGAALGIPLVALHGPTSILRWDRSVIKQ